jgi:hypothetical protein
MKENCMSSITADTLRPFAGDLVDGVRIEKVWFTGKVELVDGTSLHMRQLDFVAGNNDQASYTKAREYNPHTR